MNFLYDPVAFFRGGHLLMSWESMCGVTCPHQQRLRPQGRLKFCVWSSLRSDRYGKRKKINVRFECRDVHDWKNHYKFEVVKFYVSNLLKVHVVLLGPMNLKILLRRNNFSFLIAPFYNLCSVFQVTWKLGFLIVLFDVKRLLLICAEVLNVENCRKNEAKAREMRN